MKSRSQQMLVAISELANCNPFSTERFAREKQILGQECESLDSIAWNRRSEQDEGQRPNVRRLTELAGALIQEVRSENKKAPLPESLRQAYWDVATYLLLYRHITDLPASGTAFEKQGDRQQLQSTWESFRQDYVLILDVDQGFSLGEDAARHLFSCLFQIHRAFFNIFDFILGESLPITRLREKVWESIFTCDLLRYYRGLYDRMRDLSTLITGPSGTGKELVARAIGLSQYIPFDSTTCRFCAASGSTFLPLNLSALSPTLIESELFGHHRGAFTGAVADRAGWLESCSRHGAVFLDEIGELDLTLQVKLLRVVQQRTYCRIGEVEPRQFQGKIIAATNRELAVEIEAGRFREDFYYRLCTDRIQTPSLREQLDDCPEDLNGLVNSIARNQLDEDVDQLTGEIVDWIASRLGHDYPWSGNMRELEQCVASYIIRRDYVPVGQDTKGPQDRPIWLPSAGDDLTAEQLLSRYSTWLYCRYGSYEKTARVLQVDRRTVKSRIDPQLLQQFQDLRTKSDDGTT